MRFAVPTLAAALAAAATACSSPEVAEGKRVQAEIRRAVITSKSLGRFGTFGLFEEEMREVPCEVPLSKENRVCEVNVVGRGRVRMQVADAALVATGRVNDDALVRVEYPADCANKSFDFKTFDGVLPRSREQAPEGMTVWADQLVRVTHWRIGSPDGDRCGVVVEAAAALLERVQGSAGRG
ncbi:MAG: hypothetical protein ACOX6T_15370 [Myxococcales bacterium]|jgi:hypothetical protein